MDKNIQDAIEWSLLQEITNIDNEVTPVVDVDGNINCILLVDFVRQFYNDNGIEYDEFSYEDLTPYLPQ